MGKRTHEIRDPIYGFIPVLTSERKLIDSEPFQRLRHIHQLALTSLVYPAATHKRFEHCLGVMHLAGEVFDVVFNNLDQRLRKRLPELDENREYWRKALRAAALLHDVGHLPFSHAAEHDLLPEGASHESLTIKLIRESELADILTAKPFRLEIDDVIRLAVGPKDAPQGLEFTEWETILAEIITGSCFGVDRLDYLMRDSYHAGVAYGSLDYLRLVNCLRVLPLPSSQEEETEEAELHLGVTEGGLYSAEALVMARHWMFSQVYFHRVRVLYDVYLSEFMKEWLGPGGYPFDCKGHLGMTDHEVLVALRERAKRPSMAGHPWAKRLMDREHHKLLRSFTQQEALEEFDEIERCVKQLKQRFGSDKVLRIKKDKSASVQEFPVHADDSAIYASSTFSITLANAPRAYADRLYVDRDCWEDAEKIWKREYQNS